jgi:hypothetical protein
MPEVQVPVAPGVEEGDDRLLAVQPFSLDAHDIISLSYVHPNVVVSHRAYYY